MKICNYEIKTIPLNTGMVDGEFPINKELIRSIKGHFTFRVHCAIQYYLWCENNIPDIKEIASKFNVSNKEIEKHIESLDKQDALIFLIKE